MRWGWVLVIGLSLGCDERAHEEFGEEVLALPALEFCDGVRQWSDEDAAAEHRLLERVNERRAHGAQCPQAGRFPPANPLRLSGGASCASRVHASDMAQGDFVGHLGSDESTPWARLRASGSRFAVADQVIAAGDLSPEEIVDELWMTRPGSCAAVMASEYTEFGTGWATAPQTSKHASYVVGIVERSRSALDGD